MHQHQNKWLIGLFALIPSLAFALPSDRDQPINIEADHAQLDDKTGITQYKGRAILTQGTLRIDGDIITFYYDTNRKLKKVVAQGKKAKYQQVQKPGETPVKAEALQMEYYTGTQKIHLMGQGFVWQNGNKFSGNRIDYDIERNIVNANAKPVTIGNNVQTTTGRVHFILDPNSPAVSNKPAKAPVEKVVQPTAPNAPITPIIENEQPDPASTYPTTYTLSRLNIRTGPGTQYNKLATLDKNSQLIVLTEQNQWLQVRGISNGNVVIGWVNRSYVSPNQF